MEQEILMPPELCMQFLIWSYYYHNIEPQKGVSYRQCGRFSAADAQHLDELRDALLFAPCVYSAELIKPYSVQGTLIKTSSRQSGHSKTIPSLKPASSSSLQGQDMSNAHIPRKPLT